MIVPKLPVETMQDNEQGPLGSGQCKEPDDEDQKDRQQEESTDQYPDQAGNDDDKASVGGALKPEL